MKKIFSVIFLSFIFGTVVFFFCLIPKTKANICGSSHFTSSSLTNPSHLQVYQAGNAIRVQGKIIYKDPDNIQVGLNAKCARSSCLPVFTTGVYVQCRIGETDSACRQRLFKDYSMMCSGISP